MKAIELIGKKAIRTARTSKIGDGSYTTQPLLIINATDSHIVYEHCTEFELKMFGNKRFILGCDFCDDNWTDYDELMQGTNQKKPEPPKEPTYEKWDFAKHMKDFVDGKIAVNCRTEESANKFIKSINAIGFKLSETKWFWYKNNTCYSRGEYDGYGTIEWHVENNYTIVTYEV